MITALAAAAVLAFAPAQQADTTFAVRAGGTLELNTDGGSVSVSVWDRDAIRIATARPDRSRPRVRIEGSTVTVHTESLRPGLSNEDYSITVPRSFGVQVDGFNVEVTITGTRGDVAVSNVEGAVRIRDVTGSIEVESVSGGIVLENTRGRVAVSATNQGVRLDRVAGAVEVETVNGSIDMSGIESSQVHASTINGFVRYQGTVRDGGSYYLGAHNGQITMALAEDVNANVTIGTNSGKVETAFPVMINTLRDRRTRFTLGNGSASVELQSFNGTVHLVRPTAGR